MEREKQPVVYILASRRHGTLYTGVTSELYGRMCSHRNGTFEGFTKKYGVKMLVWFEHFPTMADAIKKEKQIKEWQRGWKIELIEKMNPVWEDLFDKVFRNEQTL